MLTKRLKLNAPRTTITSLANADRCCFTQRNHSITERAACVAADRFSTQNNMTHSSPRRSAPNPPNKLPSFTRRGAPQGRGGRFWRGMTTVMGAVALLAGLSSPVARAQSDGWGEWSTGNITDKNQTRTCNAGAGNTCTNLYSAGTTNHGGTETRPSETFWENYLVNGPAGHTNATLFRGNDLKRVTLTRDNDGRLDVAMVNNFTAGGDTYISTSRATPSTGLLLAVAGVPITLKTGLSRPNLTWTAIPGPGIVFYRPTSGNAVVLVDTLCTASGDLRVRSGQTTGSERTVQASSLLCNIGASGTITKQAIGALSATDDYIYDVWSAWSTGNITDKNQTRTCNAGAGNTCTNAYGGGTTNHGGTETRPSETFWENYLVNGPAGYTNATVREADGQDITGVTLVRENDGRLQLTAFNTPGSVFPRSSHITTGQATPSSGALFSGISLKSSLSRPNLTTWTAIPGPGVLFYRPSANNAAVLVDSLCTASGDLRVRSGTTSDTERTVQASSLLCNLGASASAITKQAIGALSASDDYIHDGWGEWSTGNITDKNQTRTCNARAGNTCTNAYGGGTTNHGGTETRPSHTFWNNYLLNGPAGHTNATEFSGGRDITGVTLVRGNDGRLQLTVVNSPGRVDFVNTNNHITTGQATPSSGRLFNLIDLKSGLSRPNLTTWATILGPGMVYYRPSANNAVVLVDSLCTASGDLRVRSGTTTDTEQTAQSGSPLCNLGASASAITRQAIGALSATDNYLYAAMPATLSAIQGNTSNTSANVDDVLTAGAVSHPTLTVNTRARQWQRCPTQDCNSATAISPGGTAATYTVQAADRGNWLRVRVTQGGDFNDTLFSNILQVSRRGAIGLITGTARVGSTLTAGAVTDADASPNTDVGTITWQWQTATASAGPFTAAPGTNNTATYTIASDQSQIGVWLRVMASYPNAGGGSLTSDPVGPVAGVRVSPTALNVTEGNSTGYRLVLGSRPTVAVTISVTSNNAAVTVSPATLTFSTINWNAAQTVTVTGAADANATNERGVQLTHTVSGGDANYAALTPPPVTVNVADNAANVIVSTTTLAVNEGETNEYTLRLNTLPTHAVTISVSSNNPAVTATASLTFTRNNWNQAQTVTVMGAEDANTTSESGVRLSHAVSSSDTRYAAVNPPAVTVSVTDNDAPGVTVSTTTLAVLEGETGEYTLRLNNQPSHAVTISVTSDNTAVTVTSPLTFTTVNWNAVQTVTVTGAEDTNTTSESVQLSHALSSADTGYAGVTPPAVTVRVTDNDAQSAVVSPPALVVNEGGTGEFTLRLATEPQASFQRIRILGENSDAADATTVSPARLFFNPTNWDTLRTITVTAVEDDDADDETVKLLVGENGITRQPLVITITDNDTLGFTLSSTSLTVTEGRTATYTIRLGSRPSATVSILPQTFNADVATVSPATPSSLDFTTDNWNMPQTVTVMGVEDTNRNHESVQLTHAVRSSDETYAALTPPSVTVGVTDNDAPGVTVSTTTLAVNEGETGEYRLSLSTLPTAPVTIAVSNPDDTAVTLSATSLTFTTDNWNVPRTVTVTGAQDTDANDETVQLTHTATSTDPGYNGGTVTISAVAVTVDDDETAGVTVSPTTLAVGEAGSGEYTLRLNTPPASDVTINVTNPDASAVTLSATSLTFTTDNWNSVQTVTVSGVEDTDADHETVQLTHTAASTDPGYNGAAVTIDSVAVTLNDNDGPGVTVSTTTLTVHERGGTGMYTLRLNTPPTEAVTISVTHSNAAAATVSPTSLMFSATDWNTAKTITVTGVEDADTDDETVQLTHTVTSTDTTYRTVTAATVTVTVTEIAAVSLDVDGSGGDPNQSDGLLLGRYLFGIRDAAGLLDTIPGSPSFNAVTTNIAGAFASGRLDVDGSGGDPNQSDGLLLGRYLFGIRDTVGLLDTIPGNPSFNEVRTNIEALLR